MKEKEEELLRKVLGEWAVDVPDADAEFRRSVWRRIDSAEQSGLSRWLDSLFESPLKLIRVIAVFAALSVGIASLHGFRSNRDRWSDFEDQYTASIDPNSLALLMEVEEGSAE